MPSDAPSPTLRRLSQQIVDEVEFGDASRFVDETRDSEGALVSVVAVVSNDEAPLFLKHVEAWRAERARTNDVAARGGTGERDGNAGHRGVAKPESFAALAEVERLREALRGVMETGTHAHDPKCRAVACGRGEKLGPCSCGADAAWAAARAVLAKEDRGARPAGGEGP